MGVVSAFGFALDFHNLCDALIVSYSSAEVDPQAAKYWRDLVANVMEKGMEAGSLGLASVFSKVFAEMNSVG